MGCSLDLFLPLGMVLRLRYISLLHQLAVADSGMNELLLEAK